MIICKNEYNVIRTTLGEKQCKNCPGRAQAYTMNSVIGRFLKTLLLVLKQWTL